jgi:hypothetical protein
MFDVQKKFIPFLVFFLIANPRMFMLTGRIFGPRIADPMTGRPTQVGVLVHALVYVLLAHLLWTLIY